MQAPCPQSLCPQEAGGSCTPGLAWPQSCARCGQVGWPPDPVSTHTGASVGAGLRGHQTVVTFMGGGGSLIKRVHTVLPPHTWWLRHRQPTKMARTEQGRWPCDRRCPLWGTLLSATPVAAAWSVRPSSCQLCTYIVCDVQPPRQPWDQTAHQPQGLIELVTGRRWSCSRLPPSTPGLHRVLRPEGPRRSGQHPAGLGDVAWAPAPPAP